MGEREFVVSIEMRFKCASLKAAVEAADAKLIGAWNSVQSVETRVVGAWDAAAEDA